MQDDRDPKDRLLDAAMAHVPFDGWSATTMKTAARDADMPADEAWAHFPRGPVDLALAYHMRGDDAMAERIDREDMSAMRFRERVAAAVRWRIEAISDKEAARRATTLFALPQHSADGARAIWGTADRIWTALGDASRDVNWYTKRATLSGVYGSTLLYWLGDDSYQTQDTWAFLDRRIGDVMQFEQLKAAVQGNALLRTMMAGPNMILSRVRAPMKMPGGGMPGMGGPRG